MIRPAPRRLRRLDDVESVRLLGSMAYGRIVFTQRALPAIRPVNHLVHNGSIVIRTHLGATLLSAVDTVVAYQADSLNPQTRTGWSVTVTGIATRVRDPDDLTRYARMLEPWVDLDIDMDETVRIIPELVTGFVLDDGA